MHFCDFDKKSHLFVIVNRNKKDEDYLIETAIKLDIEGEDVLVSYYQVEESGLSPIVGDKLSNLFNTPWIRINVKLNCLYRILSSFCLLWILFIKNKIKKRRI